MDDLDILRESDDPVVRWIANYNEGYIIDELLEWRKAYVAYWTSWRGWGRLLLNTLICVPIIIILIILLGQLP